LFIPALASPVAVAIIFVPLTRIALAPVALHFNRHR
jgi:hypothetical protein